MLGHNGGPDINEQDDDGPIRIRVIRIHINDWRASTLGLSCEEEGFFWRFNLLLYDRMGVLTDDDNMNARSLSMDVRSYRRLKARLVALGKIRIEEGRLSHPRIIREIEMYVAEYKRRSLAARIREQKKREDDELRMRSAEDRPEIAGRSAGDRAEIGRKSGEDRPELKPRDQELFNDIKGCAATTLAEGDQSLTRAHVPKPKPKPKKVEETPLAPQGGKPALLEAFETFWKAFPGFTPPKGRKTDKPKAFDTFSRIVTGTHRKSLKAKAEDIIAGAKQYAASNPDPDYIPKPTTWLNGGRWADEVAATVTTLWWEDPDEVAKITPERWKSGIAKYANGVWHHEELGPPPGHPECVVPRDIVDELQLTRKYTDKGFKR
jgi:uncharacterized protein YdaU (DUF1376 family)